MRVVQIAATSPDQGNLPVLYALTNDGKLFMKVLS